MKKQAEQTKSIFVLEVYEFAPGESHTYQVYKERCYRCAGPCAITWQTKVGYFETLRDAEKTSRKLFVENAMTSMVLSSRKCRGIALSIRMRPFRFGVT